MRLCSFSRRDLLIHVPAFPGKRPNRLPHGRMGATAPATVGSQRFYGYQYGQYQQPFYGYQQPASQYYPLQPTDYVENSFTRRRVFYKAPAVLPTFA